MTASTVTTTILLTALVLLVLITLLKAVRIIPQARAGIVERLGKYHTTLNPGFHVTVPFIDRVLPLIDLREQVVSFPAQSVITEDNLVVRIDTVVYFQVTDSQRRGGQLLDTDDVVGDLVDRRPRIGRANQRHPAQRRRWSEPRRNPDFSRSD